MKWDWSWRLEFKKENLWVGVFWRREFIGPTTEEINIWICFLPCLPIHIVMWRSSAYFAPTKRN